MEQMAQWQKRNCAFADKVSEIFSLVLQAVNATSLCLRAFSTIAPKEPWLLKPATAQIAATTPLYARRGMCAAPMVRVPIVRATIQVLPKTASVQPPLQIQDWSDTCRDSATSMRSVTKESVRPNPCVNSMQWSSLILAFASLSGARKVKFVNRTQVKEFIARTLHSLFHLYK